MRIDEAIKLAGSRRDLAMLLDVSRQAVHQWIKNKKLPELQAYRLKEAIGRKRGTK